jgi:hypothetical protein
MSGQSKSSSTVQHNIDSLIGTDTRLDGDPAFSGGLRVDGEVHGSISSDATKHSRAPWWSATRWNSSPKRVSQVTLNTVKSKFSWELPSKTVSCIGQPRRAGTTGTQTGFKSLTSPSAVPDIRFRRTTHERSN